MAKTKVKATPHGTWVAFFGVVEAIVDRFGWPGLLLIFAMYFLEKYATIDQKREIIDAYFLGKGVRFEYPFMVLGAAFLLAFFAQRIYYIKKLKLEKDEVLRLGEWKTKHQEKKIGGPLHHSGGAQD